MKELQDALNGFFEKTVIQFFVYISAILASIENESISRATLVVTLISVVFLAIFNFYKVLQVRKELRQLDEKNRFRK